MRGVTPYLKVFSELPGKRKKKGEPPQRLSQSSGCIYLSHYITLRLGGNAPYCFVSVKFVMNFSVSAFEQQTPPIASCIQMCRLLTEKGNPSDESWLQLRSGGFSISRILVRHKSWLDQLRLVCSERKLILTIQFNKN